MRTDDKPGDYYEHARLEILPLLPVTFDSVVDFGGASGRTLSAIRTRHPSVKTVCVDADEQSLLRAGESGHVVIRCDLALFLDVLEHLVDPWSVLSSVVQKLRTNALVIVSLPNVRFWEASLNLTLRGRWHLRDAGVLDRTHLRFFTKNSGGELLRSSGLVIEKTRERLAGGRRYRLLNILSLGVFSDFLTCQYVYVGRKESV